MQINTTSDEIVSWSQEIEKRLKKEPGFENALETDFETQRSTESLWLKHKKINSSLAPLSPERLRTLSALWKSGGFIDSARLLNLNRKGNYFGNKLFSPICCFASSIVSANELFSLSSRLNFRDALNKARADVEFASAEEPNFIVKTSLKDCKASECDILHEAIVGIFGTNSLRPIIPNFPYVYAVGFSCAPPSSTEEVAKLASPRRKRGGCSSVAAAVSTSSDECIGGTTPFLVLENFSNSSSLKSVIHSGGFSSFDDFYAILMQIVYALKYAYEKISFTHYDLTPETILLRPLSTTKKTYIPYDEANVFIHSKYVATFTEFGFSHVSVQNSEKRLVSFGFAAKGRSSMVTYGIFRDRANPICDIYRLLILCIIEAKEVGNENFANEAFKLFKYFNQTESLEDIISRQASTSYYLPLTTRTRGYSFEEFISFSKKEAKASKWENCFTTLSLPPQSSQILGSGAGLTTPFQQRINTSSIPNSQGVFGSSFNVTENFLGFYDIYSLLVVKISSPEDADSARSFTKAFINRFSEGVSCFNNSIRHARKFITEKYNEFVEATTSDNFKYATLPQKLTVLLVDENSDVFKTLNKISYLLDIYEQIVEMSRVFNYCVSLYWKEQTDLPEEITELRKLFDEVVKAITEPLLIVYNLISTDVKELSKNTKEVKSFREKAPTIVSTYENVFGKYQDAFGVVV